MGNTRIEAGRLNREMEIQQDVGTEVGTTGNTVPDWQPWPNEDAPLRWVSLEQLSGREIERAAMMQVEATHRIEMYWVSGLSAVKFRGVIGSRIFNFGIVNNVDDANIKLEIVACEQIG